MIETSRKAALVTGAAKRLGRSIALELARRGWAVAVHYHHSAEEAEATVAAIRDIGQSAAAVSCNLADETQAGHLLERAAQALGITTAEISCVVNNASLFDYDDAASFSYENLDRHMHANLAAPILLTNALHEATPEGMQSVAINLLDQKLDNLNPDFLSYTMSKAALQTATVMLAQALAPKMRVVGVSPGITLVSGTQTEAAFQRAHRNTPLGRSSTPEDIAAAVTFLAEAQAITGTTLVVDGGQHLVSSPRDVMFTHQ
jgi:NAD(P)-dependent dehydrogenase (short-subunit alcohol dehydrogenase family)